MTWTKLSDDFTDDCWTLSDAAYRVHSDGLVWSNRKLLDCVIPKEDVYRFAKRPEAVQELLDAGYWSDLGTAYVIRHHAQYQRLREAVIRQQEANAANGAKGGRPREQVRELKTEPLTQSVAEPLTERVLKTDSLTQSPTERDGPGLALEQEALSALPVSSKDPVLPSSEFCHGCRVELDAWSTGSVCGHCLDCSGDCSNCMDVPESAAVPA
jgi:hypothetical protein